VSKIKIRRAHALSSEQARAAAEKIAARLNEAFEMKFAWEEDVLRFQRSGVEGHLALRRREVIIHAELDFVLALMQPSIEQAIQEYLDKVFGARKKARKTMRKKTAKKH
jgi:putative polyhydroxyalkanoate system protein